MTCAKITNKICTWKAIRLSAVILLCALRFQSHLFCIILLEIEWKKTGNLRFQVIWEKRPLRCCSVKIWFLKTFVSEFSKQNNTEHEAKTKHKTNSTIIPAIQLHSTLALQSKCPFHPHLSQFSRSFTWHPFFWWVHQISPNTAHFCLLLVNGVIANFKLCNGTRSEVKCSPSQFFEPYFLTGWDCRFLYHHWIL